MSATLDRPKTRGRRSGNGAKPEAQIDPAGQMSREQAAEAIYPLLSDEPQTEAQLRRRFRGDNKRAGDDIVHNALAVLESQHKAMRMPVPSTGKDGWALYNEGRLAAMEHPQELEFPYKWAMLKVEQMFVDSEYQRPITSFVDRITARFNPLLFGVLVLSDRGTRNKPKRYAVIDGQTRWRAASRKRVGTVPCLVFTGLTPQDEADLFARLQQERRNVTSYFGFRADLAAGKPEALAVRDMVESVGYTLGNGPGQMRAVKALVNAFRGDEEALERTLADLRDAFPDTIPEDYFITGLHQFFMHYPIGQRKRPGHVVEIHDEVLVRTLQGAGILDLKRAVDAYKEQGEKGGRPKLLALAIQKRYDAELKRSRKRR